MKINSASNYYSKVPSFGATMDNNTKAILRAAKEQGINTEKMENLMGDLFIGGEVHTELFKDKKVNDSDRGIAVTSVVIGKP